MAYSMLLHLTVFSIFLVISAKRESYKDIDYISADLILPSEGGGRFPLSSHQQSSPQPSDIVSKEEPRPRSEGPAAEDELGAVNKVPLSDPNAPSQGQTAAQPSGGSSGGTDTGTVYQPYHAVSRVPYFKTQIKPVYPSSERAAGVEARVTVEVYINERGMVDKVKLVKSGGELFDQAVMQAVKDSSFEPGYLEGRPVPVRIQIPYAFKLR